jgi:hypothetical protein
VSIVGASGTIANNTIIGSGDRQPGVGGATDGTGVLLFGAHDVTVDHNTITGAGTNLGVAVASDTTNAVISFNQIGRTTADDPDPTGIGVVVDAPNVQLSPAALEPAQGPSTATLICNTFSGWNANIVGAVQVSCVPLPNGTECEPYSVNTLSVQGGTAPYTWSLASGTLPPGLGMAPSDGAITGTPTQAGTYDFAVMVVDSTGPALTATQGQSITIVPGCVAPTTPTAPPTVAPPTEPPTVAPPPTDPGVAPIAELPPTGSDSSAPLYLGVVVVVLGAFAVIITARRRASRT